jgi:hypothetical protein
MAKDQARDSRQAKRHRLTLEALADVDAKRTLDHAKQGAAAPS